MVSLNKSFIYGTIFASFTWSMSLYLYWQINSKEISDNLSTHEPSAQKAPHIMSNDVLKMLEQDNMAIKNVIDKSQGSVYKYNNYKENLKQNANWNKFRNSKTLIDNLQPVVQKASDNLEINELGMVKSKEDQMLKDEGYKVHAFNVLISNRIDNHRNIPDTRNALCKNQTYSKNLPTASVIICFYNEHFQTLKRSIHSIIDRTPSNLLKEIILIDDFSDSANLNTNISDYIKSNLHDNIKLFKTKDREGLIRARMMGAQKATGKVIVFLDSHIEVNEKWLEPLLERIHANRTNVVMPVIDIINADTFQYTPSPLVRGGFNWGLHFKWENLPAGTLSKAEDFIKPIKSPTMAGGLFAMDKQYFFELGEYDPGMNIWGGENLEISFRIWMCGGKLEMVPCSRVGHVFRRRRPYAAPNGEDTMLRNSLRVAHVWMDQYKEHFISQRPDSANLEFGDISSRQRLREDLKCHNFSWYLDNVYPELTLPTDNDERLKNKWAALEQSKFQPWHSRKRNYIGQYQIRLSNTNLCMQSAKDVKTKGSVLVLANCLRSKNQFWYETDRHELVLAKLLCLEAEKPSVKLGKCHEMGGPQEWKHKSDVRTPIYNMAAGTCLSVQSKEIGASVTLELCSNADLNQWDLII